MREQGKAATLARASLQLPREVIEEQLVLQAIDRGVLRDVDELDFHHPRPVAQLLGGHVVGKDGVMCAACGDPAFHARGEAGHGSPHDSCDRQVRHGKNQLYGLDVLHDEAESAAHVNKAHNDGLAELSFKDKSDGVFFIHADA